MAAMAEILQVEFLTEMPREMAQTLKASLRRWKRKRCENVKKM
jgi:hypothetical protein